MLTRPWLRRVAIWVELKSKWGGVLGLLVQCHSIDHLSPFFFSKNTHPFQKYTHTHMRTHKRKHMLEQKNWAHWCPDVSLADERQGSSPPKASLLSSIKPGPQPGVIHASMPFPARPGWREAEWSGGRGEERSTEHSVERARAIFMIYRIRMCSQLWEEAGADKPIANYALLDKRQPGNRLSV